MPISIILALIIIAVAAHFGIFDFDKDVERDFNNRAKLTIFIITFIAGILLYVFIIGPAK